MFEIGETVIIVDEQRHYSGLSGTIVGSIDATRWRVHVRIPEDRQRSAETGYVLKEFTGAFYESELRPVKNR